MCNYRATKAMVGLAELSHSTPFHTHLEPEVVPHGRVPHDTILGQAEHLRWSVDHVHTCHLWASDWARIYLPIQPAPPPPSPAPAHTCAMHRSVGRVAVAVSASTPLGFSTDRST